MGKPWADLSSAERLDAILLAVHEITVEGRGISSDATGNNIAWVVSRSHSMENPRHGNHGTGNVARAMALATRVTPGITALRNRGLLRFARRLDGYSGTADYLTPEGSARVHALKAAAA